MNESTVPAIFDASLEVIITGWLHEHGKHWDSEHGQWQHTRTSKAYDDTLRAFQKSLQAKGLDLDCRSEEELTQVSLIAQAFASSSTRARQVKPATKNLRLATISSFYEYAKGKKFLRENPIDNIKRDKVQAYAAARALPPETTQDAFASIDRSTLKGKRDYALLAIGMETGHRLQALAALQLRHLTMNRGRITVTFEHCKGDEQMRVTLPAVICKALLSWLHSFYGPKIALGRPGDDRPVWVSLANGGRAGKSYGQQLGDQAIADVCQKYLGSSKAHTMRHTFAHGMVEAGAPVNEIQAKLGHKSLATTGRYLAQLGQDENKYGDKLADLLGIR